MDLREKFMDDYSSSKLKLHSMAMHYPICIHLYISCAMYVIYLQCVRDVCVYSYTLSTFHNHDFI